MRFDLHVHTTLSPCSELSLYQLMSQAQVMGLDGVCVTDHNTMAIRSRISEGTQPNGLCLLFGMEYATTRGDFLLFGPFEHLPPGLPAPELLPLVHAAGGVAIAAHPFRSGRETDEALIASGLCRIIEGKNGRNHPWENAQALSWQDRYGVTLVGGSDAHSIAELGKTATRFHHRLENRRDFIAALKAGDFTLEQEEPVIASLRGPRQDRVAPETA